MSWGDTPTLVGRNVRLRPLYRHDCDALLAAASDLCDPFYTSVPTPGTIGRWLDTAFSEQRYGRAMPFAVLDASDVLIGSTRFLRMSRAHRRVEIGATFYATTVYRSPVNTEAKLLLLRYAFEVLDCHVVQIRTDWFNQRSQTAIERLGARRDGVLRNHQVAADGRIRDIVVYSINAGEWAGVCRNLNHLQETGA